MLQYFDYACGLDCCLLGLWLRLLVGIIINQVSIIVGGLFISFSELRGRYALVALEKLTKR